MYKNKKNCNNVDSQNSEEAKYFTAIQYNTKSIGSDACEVKKEEEPKKEEKNL